MKRSAYKYYWYNNVLTMVKRYPGIKDDMTIQSGIFSAAIEHALADVEKLEDGDERLRAIRMRYFDKSHTVDGVAAELYVSPSTVKRWSAHFIRLVGKYAGY